MQSQERTYSRAACAPCGQWQLASVSGVRLGYRLGLSVPLPQEVSDVGTGVEEVTVPFGSCQQDLGVKTALEQLQSLVSAKAVEKSCGEPWEQGQAGSQVVPGSCSRGWWVGGELMRMSGLWRG